MKIIKEYCKYANLFIIRSDSYSFHLDHILNLYKIAKESFPELREVDVRVVEYHNDSYDKTFGIEFRIFDAVVEIPEDFILIEKASKIY